MSRSVTSQLIVSLLDRVSGPAAKAGAALTTLRHRAAFAVGVPITGVRNAVAGIEAGARKASAAVDKISAAATPLALGSLFGFNQALKFEKSMNLLSELGNLTKAQRRELEDYLQKLNAKYPQSLSVLARSMIELNKAGLSMAAAKGSIGSAMDLAVFGEIEPSRAAGIMAAAINQFRLAKSTVEEAKASSKRVADVIVYAANKSAVTVDTMGETFKYVAPMATSLGMSLEQVAAGAMIMGNAGIKGSEAGVAFRSGLVRMIKPTKDMQRTLARLNIDLGEFLKKGHDTTAGELISSLAADGIDATPLKAKLEKVLADPVLKAAPARMIAGLTKIISEGLGSSSIVDKDKLSEAINETITVAGTSVDFLGFMREAAKKAGPEFASVVARLFDVRQSSRLMTLATGDVQAQLDGLINEAAGYAEKGAAAMLAGTVRPLVEMSAALEGLFVNISKSGVFEAVARTAEAITALTRSLGDANPAFLKWGTYAVAAAASFSVLKTVMKAAAGVLSLLRIGLAAALSPLGLVAGGLAGLAAFNWQTITEKASAFSKGFQKGWADNFKIPDDVIKSWERLGVEIQKVMGAKPGLDKSAWQSLGEKIGVWLKGMVSSAANAFRDLANAAADALAKINARIEHAGNIILGGGPNDIKRGLPKGFSLPGKAAGGPVIGGKPYIVGEAGPELFVPRTSGSIIPNGAKLGGGQLSIVNYINISAAASDARTVADAVAREIERRVNESLRTVQADFGLRWA